MSSDRDTIKEALADFTQVAHQEFGMKENLISSFAYAVFCCAKDSDNNPDLASRPLLKQWQLSDYFEAFLRPLAHRVAVSTQEPSASVTRVKDQRGVIGRIKLLHAMLETKTENAAADPYSFMAQLAAITTNIQHIMGYDKEAEDRAKAFLG